MTCGGVRQAQSAYDRQGFAAPMADDTDPIHPEEQGPAVFSMVEPLLDAFEIAAQER